MEKKFNTTLSDEVKKGKPSIMIHFDKSKNNININKYKLLLLLMIIINNNDYE